MAYNPNNNTFTTLTDLAGQVGTSNSIANVLGGSVFNDGGGGTYYWDDTSTATPDGVKIVQVSGITTGRWMRAKANAYGTTAVSFSGLSLITTYTVSHGQSFTPAQIHIQPTNLAAASSIAYVPNASINSTTFQIVFASLPTLSTITFNVFAIRGN